MGFSPSALNGTTAGTGLSSSGAARHCWRWGAMGSFLPSTLHGTTAGTGLSSSAHSTALLALGGNGPFLLSTLHGTTAGTGLSSSGALHGTAGTGAMALFSQRTAERHHCWRWSRLFPGAQHCWLGGMGSSPYTARRHCWHWPRLFWRTARHCWHWGNGLFPSTLHGTTAGTGLQSPLAHTARHCWHWGNGSFSTLHGTTAVGLQLFCAQHGTLWHWGVMALSPLAHCTAPLLALASALLAHARHRWHPGAMGSFSPAHCTAPLLHWLSSFWRTARTAGTGGTGSFSPSTLHGTTAGWPASASASTALLALGAMAFLPEHCTAPLLALASASGAQHGTAGTVGHGSSPTLHGTTAGTGLWLFWRTARHCWHWGNRLFSSALHGTTAGTGLSSSGAQHGTAGTGAMGLSPQHTARHHCWHLASVLLAHSTHCWHWGGQWPLS
jgi:hypothetical protein